jgi:small subunit ribosomal protein S20
MANKPASKKAVRKTQTRTAVNGARRSRVRTFLRRVEEALAAGDAAKAREALAVAEPEMARAVSRGVIHKNTQARKISRLAQRVRKLATA